MDDNIKVDLAELIKAAMPTKMKRLPRGVKGVICKTTQLDATILNKLIIHAPAHSTVLSSTGRLDAPITVDAGSFYLVLSKLPNEQCIEMSIKNSSLLMTCGKLKVTFPIKD